MNTSEKSVEYIVRYMSEEILKILKINLLEDTFEVVKTMAGEEDDIPESHGHLSEWLHSFLENNQVYKYDIDRFRTCTDNEYMRNYFLNGKRKLSVSYRRMIDGQYKWVAMRIIPSMEYSPDNQEVIMFIQDDDSAESLDLIQTMKQQFAILTSMSEIYVSLHAINFEEDSVYDLSQSSVNNFGFVKTEHASELMRTTMRARVSDAYLDEMLEFSELTTMQERMKGKKYITKDFLGRHLGWVRALFIAMDHDKDGYPMHVILAISSIEEEKRKEEKLLQISTEMNLATAIQTNTIPHIFPAFPEKSEIELYASMDPAKEVGGDFYDYFLIDENRVGLVIADVSGKGVPAALFMMISKVLLKNQAQSNLSPARVLERVNKQLCDGNAVEMFVTVWLGVLDLKSGHLTAANAGHEYPILRKKGQEYALYKDRHGFVLAGMDNMKYKEYEIQLEPGDEIFLYTDGVTEATNSENQLFGTDRLLEALNAGECEECRQIVSNVRKHIDAFVGDAPQFDDITMLSLRYYGEGESCHDNESVESDVH